MKKIIYSLILILTISCSPKLFKDKWTQERAPEYFNARFETTKGNFDLEAKREWSPEGVDRLYQLIKNDYYTDIALFRVIPGFVVQFGIHNDSLINKLWEKHVISDESVIQSNDSMAISFARDGVDSRTTQIFINLKDNHRLDTVHYNDVTGFPVVAKIISGMETVHKFNSEYGAKPSHEQDSIYNKGNAYLKEKYPKMDYIKRAYLIKPYEKFTGELIKKN
ncbi:peptidylprolyl isomerase [Urechidicola croceus]|uniref:peptidylprolyl isomerase n=1 Tax=Urechidicola croceus TaxID=1850246 RepID=A0A1D8PBG0_9FLAO|nr:peptidylprolyl isomerase [Urechidicola croceus]AOW21906.1 peptidylprolyl isomerase [Urechidicola croceus]